MQTTIYYTLSTIAQVQGAIIAILGVFLFFKTQRINDIQLGQGHAILDSYTKKLMEIKNKRISDMPLNDLDYRTIRLVDALYRKNIYGVEESILYKIYEEIESDSATEYGYKNHVGPKFFETNRFLSRIKIWTIVVLGGCILSLFYSVISLSITHLGVQINLINQVLRNFILYSNLILFIGSVLGAFAFLIVILFTDLPFEKHKKETCNEIRKKIENLEVRLKNNQ